MNGQHVVQLAMLFSDAAVQFFPPIPSTSRIYVNHHADFPSGTIAVTSAAAPGPIIGSSLYIKLPAGPGWRYIMTLSVNHRPVYRIPAAPSTSHAESNLETLPQHNYRNHSRAHIPEMELAMQYCSVPLSSALEERGISAPDEPAFARDAPIGEKLSVCLWVKGVCLRRKRTDGFTSKQHRVRSGKGKEGQPITRANLARLVALDVQRFMNLHQVHHNGSAVTFYQLRLKEVRLKSKATLQPVLCFLPTAGSAQR